jgi:hypothetical protein
MTPQARVRASEMLARLRMNRFMLFAEDQLVTLGIPYDLRRSTQDEVLRQKAERPFNKMHTPPMSSEASFYWEQRDCWCRESKACQSTALSIGTDHVWGIVAKAQAHEADRFQPPITDREYDDYVRYRSVIGQLIRFTEICAELWAGVPDLDKLRFYDPKPQLKWACDYPTLAVTRDADHTYAYWPEGLPEYRRQIRLLEWAVGGT